jgi:D-alanyl-D-alanine carboxypeptidase/D-alanyl-D-alanine-endopeptidase (penicillin-binding protein 4)
VLIVVLAAAAMAGGYVGSRQWRDSHQAARLQPTSSAPDAALARATGSPATPSPSPAPVTQLAALAAALRGPLDDPALGARTLVEVRDALTGAELYSHGARTPAAPASTAKLATAVAVLALRGGDDRIVTRVVRGQPGTVVLVGGGDPTLSAAAPGGASAYPDAARVSDLAHQLRQHSNVQVNRIVVDGTLYHGPSVSPYWAPEDIPSDYAAPITAAMVDGGRAAPGDTVRSTAPDLAAGKALAAALGRPDLPVSRGSAPPLAVTLASVGSAPIGDLVGQMLDSSDNVIAESLARQVALARRQPASFAGAAVAVRQVLLDLGVDVGPGMLDSSGLAARDRLTPDALTGVVRLAASSEHPALHVVIDALPVAGWSGTLAGRYVTPPADAGAGLVRAKTGTLTSVSTLAGLAHDADGRLLAFAVMADRVGATAADTSAAEAAIDRVAATLASCGCP